MGHVEAGLRTYNLYSPFPEEFNRQAISIVSKYNFAPTEKAKNNLLQEGKTPENIYVTGNTAIDALKTTVKEEYFHKELEWAKDSRMILITAHRRENLGEPMKNMFKAIKRVLDEHDNVKAIYPIHMNPLVRETAQAVFGQDDRIHIIEPLVGTEVETIYKTFTELLDNPEEYKKMSQASNPYGDGFASERIADILEE